MIDISRRQAIQITGASTAASAMPVVGAVASQAQPSTDLLALRDKVQKLVDDFDPASIFAHAQYAKISEYGSAIAEHCGDCDNHLEDGVTFKQARLVGGAIVGQHFVYHIKHDEVGLGFAVRPGAHDLEKEITPTLQALTQSFLQQREIDAAAAFNKPTTYFAEVGGNGRPLCSREHPHDEGMWSNQMYVDCSLNPLSLEAALKHIRTQYVDQGGVRIRARGRLLVTGPALEPDAIRAAKAINLEEHPEFTGHMTWDYLEHDHHWFVLTDVPGLRWSERRPFRIRTEVDTAANAVMVIGDEKRGFGCYDQRAVFGSLPTA